MIRAFTSAAVVILITLITCPVEAAQQALPDAPPVPEHATGPVSLVATVERLEHPPHDNLVRDHRLRSRPVALPALYTTSAALNAYDVYSTRRALAHGGRELNPLMRGVVQDTATFIALKTGVMLSAILAGEQLWRDHPIAAISTLVAVNAIAAAAAVHNARVLRHQRGVVGGHTR